MFTRTGEPKIIDNNFIRYPNTNTVFNICNFDVSCIHREEIKILNGIRNYLSNNFPHLIHGTCFNLLDHNCKLNVIYLVIIMITSLDLSMSPV